MKLSRLITVLVLPSIFIGCNNLDDSRPTDNPRADLLALPSDSGGTHVVAPLGTTDAAFGYFMYEPGGYQDSDKDYPLLVYLHGAGDLRQTDRADELNEVLRNGPPKLIDQGNWSPQFPMLVVSPQQASFDWQANELQDFLNFIEQRYRVNPSRIYFTGISLGAVGIIEYVRNVASQSKAAALVPISAGGSPTLVNNFIGLPIWSFHGERDRIVPFARSRDWVNAINAFDATPKARLTAYPGLGHDAWTRTYDGTGMGQENADFTQFSQNIYDWMFTHKKD